MKRSLAVAFMFAVVFTVSALAQSNDQPASGSAQASPAQAPPAQAPATQTPPGQQPPQATGKETKEEKKKRKEKEKQDKAGTESDAVDSAVFTQKEANEVLGMIRDGLEGHTQKTMLRAFSADRMNGYLSFEDQLESFFNRFDAIAVHIIITNSNVEGDKGIVNASFQMELTTRAGISTRRDGELRFELEHTKKGWKVVDFTPRDFFS